MLRALHHYAARVQTDQNRWWETMSSKNENAPPLKRLQPFKIQFPGTPVCTALCANPEDDPVVITDRLRLQRPSATIFITGGAGHMDAEATALTRPLIEHGLIHFAQNHDLTIIDGGTESGVMALIGQARRQQNATFPLVGVAPIGTINYPGYHNPDGKPLDPGHSHFVLLKGGAFGDESDMIYDLALALAATPKTCALGLVVNGGEITRKETIERVVQGGSKALPLLVVEGSGRFADDLADVRDGRSHDPELRTILDVGEIEFIHLRDGAPALRQRLARFFT